MNQIPLTGLTFFSYWVTRQESFIPIIVANSIVGIYYTYTERNVLKEEGAYAFGVKYKFKYWQNALSNLLGHVLMTGYILKTHKDFRYDYSAWLVSSYVGMYLILFDYEKVYVSNVNTFDHYLDTYFACLFMILVYYRYRFVTV